jgi:hypothetical protein
MTTGTPKQTLQSPAVLRVELKLMREETTRYEAQINELQKGAMVLNKEHDELKHASHEEIKQRNVTIAQEQRQNDSELRELRDKFTISKVEIEEERRMRLEKQGNVVKVASRGVEASCQEIKKTFERSLAEYRVKMGSIRQQLVGIHRQRWNEESVKLKTIAESLELSLEQPPNATEEKESRKVKCVIGEAICCEQMREETCEPTRPSSGTQCNLNAPIVVPSRLVHCLQYVKSCLKQ